MTTFSELAIEKIPVGPLYTNCFIVYDCSSKSGIVIDPGDDGDLIAERVGELGLKLEGIYATHGHFDHVGGSGPLKEKTGAKFMLHSGDLFFLEDAVESALRWGIRIVEPAVPDGFLEGGEKIVFGSQSMEVIATPGHSPGGISFYSPGHLVSGDCLFEGSIGRTDFREGSLETLASSIKGRLYILPEDTIVHTGHGPDTTIGREMRSNPFINLR